MTESDTLTIDVVSDVVCPWCYLEEKRLEAALSEKSTPYAGGPTSSIRPHRRAASTGRNTWSGNSAGMDG